MPSPWLGPTYPLASKPASVQRAVNLEPLPLEPGNERTPWVYKDTAGLAPAPSWAYQLVNGVMTPVYVGPTTPVVPPTVGPCLWDPAISDVGAYVVTGQPAQTGWVILPGGKEAKIAGFTQPPGLPAPHLHLYGTVARSSGKRYFEISTTDGSSTNSTFSVGKMGIAAYPLSSFFPAYASGFLPSDADGSEQAGWPIQDVYGWSPAFAGTHTMQFAVNLDNGHMWLGKDGTFKPTVGSLIDPVNDVYPIYYNVFGSFRPWVSYFGAVMYGDCTLRATAADFVYAPPSGFVGWGD